MKCCRHEYIKKVELDLQNFGEFSTEIRIRISNLEVKRLEDIYTLDILFPSNPNIHESSCGLCFWALDPLIERF